MSIVVRTIDNHRIERHLQELRTRGGNTITHRKSGLNNIREMIRSFRGGGAVDFLVDQAVSRRQGLLVPFFGKQAWSSPAPARIAVQTGATIVPAFIERDDDNPRHYIIRAYGTIRPEPTGDLDADVERLTIQIQAALEQRIRDRPQDWFWVHRRWKRSPDAPEDY